MRAYTNLLKIYRETAILASIRNVLSWDRSTALPAGGEAQRGEEQALLAQLVHRKISSKNVGRLVDKLEKKQVHSKLNDVQKRNVELIRLDHDAKTKVPDNLVGEVVKQQAAANKAREKAFEQNDWNVFEPEFEKLFSVHCELSEHLMDVYEAENLYDVNIETFEHGMTSKKISTLFDELKSTLPDLIEKFRIPAGDVRSDFLSRPVKKENQIELVKKLAAFIGYDMTSEEAFGRIGEGAHPVSLGQYDDIRILMNYEENDLFRSCIAFLHEAGHSLHSRNIRKEWRYTPVGARHSIVSTESQARFTENMIGRSPWFMEYYLPLVNEVTDGQFNDVTALEFSRAVNRVKPVSIRVISDEISYNIHIMIRFEIELGLFEGDIDIPEIPVVWNELHEKYLGIEVQNDSDGVLQDMHWGAGLFGYFPTYALGSIMAAQLAETMTQQIPDWKEDIRLGQSSAVMDWMDTNIHKQGSLYDTLELVEHVTDKPLSSEPFINYIKGKFSTLYG